MAPLDLREELKRDLRRHPRVELQGLYESTADREKLAESLPVFLPFMGKTYQAMWFQPTQQNPSEQSAAGQ